MIREDIKEVLCKISSYYYQYEQLCVLLQDPEAVDLKEIQHDLERVERKLDELSEELAARGRSYTLVKLNPPKAVFNVGYNNSNAICFDYSIGDSTSSAD